MIMRDRSLRQQLDWLCEKKRQKQVVVRWFSKHARKIELNLSSRFPERKSDVTERFTIVQVLMSPYLRHISIVNTFFLIHGFFFPA